MNPWIATTIILAATVVMLVVRRRTSGKANSGSTRRRSINEGEGGLNARNATLTGFRAASLPPSDSKRGPHRKHSGGRNHRPGAISDRKAGIALNDLPAQQRPLARFPERCRVDDPVAKRTAIGTIAARDRAWNADELGPHFIAGEPHRRIAVTAHIHEFKVRGKFRIGNGVSALQVETPGVFEARADAVLEEHVVGPFGLTRWPIGQEQRAERMIPGQTVLKSLHRPRAGQRGADETDPDRLERGGWQQGGGIAGPEAVTIARHDRESGDLRIADEVIDFATLVVGAAIIAAADLREGVGRPLLLGHSIGKVLRVGAQIEGAQRIAPDLPGCRGPTELVHEPFLLTRPEQRARR